MNYESAEKEKFEEWKGRVEEMLSVSLNNIGIIYKTPYDKDEEHWRYRCESFKHIKKDKENLPYVEYCCFIKAEYFSDYCNSYLWIWDDRGYGRTIDECLENTILKYKENKENESKKLKQTEHSIGFWDNIDYKRMTFDAMTDGQLGSWDDFEGGIDGISIWSYRENAAQQKD